MKTIEQTDHKTMKYIAEDKEDFHYMLQQLATAAYEDGTYPDVVSPDEEITVRLEDFIEYCRYVDISEFDSAQTLYEHFVDTCYAESRNELYERD